jgi:hypothetical protein
VRRCAEWCAPRAAAKGLIPGSRHCVPRAPPSPWRGDRPGPEDATHPGTSIAARVIRGDDPFDLAAAQRIARALAAGGAETIEVDLRHVRVFHDHGVAYLGQVLVAHVGRVSVRGLRRHHFRLLRYLGISPGANLGAEDEAA